MTKVQPRLLNYREACAYLNVSRSTLDRFVKAKAIAVVEVAGKRFTTDALDEFITRQTVPVEVPRSQRPSLSLRERKAAAS